MRVPFQKKVNGSGRPTVWVQLTVRLELPSNTDAGRYVTCIVDSGATSSIFHARFAKDLGLDLQSGKPMLVVGVGGKRIVWLHKVQLQLPGGPVLIEAGFHEDLPVNGLLGMSGFFEHFRMTFDGVAQTCEFERLT